jgi:ligand-binding sensor domain-containing protein
MTSYYRKTGILVIFLILIFGAIISYAETDDAGEVLIGNELHDIAMDEDYVWVATERGVNRYDRKSDKWTFFTVSDGLISNQVNCVAPEFVEGILGRKSGDEVWFGTDSGVSVYYKKTGLWKSYTTKDGLIHNKVNVISARGDDVWIGTDKGVSAYDKKKNSWTSYASFPGISSPKVTAVYHQSNYAWIGTEDGLARYNYRYRKWEYFKSTGSSWYGTDGAQRNVDGFPLIDNHINSIDGEAQYVYIATNSSLIVFDIRAAQNTSSEKRGYSASNRSQRVQQDAQYRPLGRSGDRLAMTENRSKIWEQMGWTYIDIASLSASKSQEVSSSFNKVAYRSKQTWIATNRGVIRLDFLTGERQTFRKANGLIDDEVTSIATTGGEVWAGTVHGLSRYNAYKHSWTNYRIERALPSSYITALAEDKDGMWFGTKGAVSRYRNERWKTWTRDEGLAGTYIRSIAVVGNYVWFGTDEGISRLNKSTLSWDSFKANKNNLVSNDIKSVLVDGKYIWVGTKNGLNRYDNTTGTWDLYSIKTGLLDDYVTSIVAEPESVWIGTKLGLSRYNKKSDDWVSFKREDDLNKNAITSLALSKDNVWVASKKGLSSLDRKTDKWTDYIDKPLTAITIQQDKPIIWLGGRRSISRYELDTGKTTTFGEADLEGISRVSVFGIQDSAQYVWFATDGGIYRYSKLDGKWWVYSPSTKRGSMDTLVDGNVRAITADKDYAYFGTAGGISRYDKITGNWVNWTEKDGLINNDVYALLLDDADLWIGTKKGISKYDTVTDSWTSYTISNGLPSDIVYSLAISKNPKKRIWAGTRGGVAYLVENEPKWQKITMANGLPDNCVWSVGIDSNAEEGELWFGTNKGVAKYNHINETWRIYTIEDGLIDNIVTSVGFAGKYVFINTIKGANIYDRELDTWTPFTAPEGLIGTVVKCVGAEQELKQKVWIGTDGGATLYDFVTDKTKNYVENDGLASNNVQSIMVDDKDVWFGSDSGLSRYDTLSDQWVTYKKESTVAQKSASADLISPNIKSMTVDANYLWVGTRIGLSRYDKTSGIWEKFELPKDASGSSGSLLDSPLAGTNPEVPPTTLPFVRTMTANGKHLWLGTKDGFYIYDTSSRNLTGFSSQIDDSSGSDNIITDNISNIFVNKGKIWLISDKLIAIFEKYSTSNLWTFVTDNRIEERSYFSSGPGGNTISASSQKEDFNKGIGLLNLMVADVNNDLVWIGKEKGLAIFNVKRKKVDNSIKIPQSLSDKTVTAIGFDEKSAWIGTRDGLYHYNFASQTWDIFTTETGLASNRVSSMAVDDNYVWVGSSNRGVSCYDKLASTWRIFNSENGLDDNNIRAIVVDSKYVWFGTFSGGICRYDKSADLWTTYRSADNKLALGGSFTR